MTNQHRCSATQRILGAVLAGVLSAGLLAVAAPAPAADAASPRACKTRVVGKVGSYRSLAAAVRKARNGNTIRLKGTCEGSTTIRNKRLTIVGVKTKRSGAPVLRSDGRRRVLTLKGARSRVTLKGVSVKGRPKRLLGFEGGGIRVEGGKVILVNSKVRDFTVSRRGGGISLFRGSVTLKGSSVVKRNIAMGDGGGIHSEGDGQIRLEDSSTIRMNATLIDGGGIRTEGADIALRDRSSIVSNLAADDGDGGGIYADTESISLLGSTTVAGNEARKGGGIRTQGPLTMSAGASITGNNARQTNGGIDYAAPYAPVGVVCAPDPGANVYGNTPNDCGT